MSSGDQGIEVMDVEGVDQFNNENLTKSATQLQTKLDMLREQLNKARAQKVAFSETYGVTDKHLFKEVTADQLHKLTETRTKTFLNFTSLQAVMRATKTNQTLSEALGLEKSDELRLEPEEMEYVRELLEEHRLLSESFLKHHEIGTEQEFQIIEARTKLAGLLCKYQELRNQAGPLLFSESEKDKELLVLEKRMREEDLRINQIRMMIQKMMIGEKKLGQLFDKETNTRFKEMFLRCGMFPDELRKEKLADISE